MLFVDQNNGCLSRIAQAVATGLGAKRFTFDCAGLVAGAVEPQTIRFLAEKGVDVSHQPSKSLDQVPNLDQVQVIVALCREAEAAFPQKPTKSLGLQWLVPDPALAHGTPEDLRVEYERAFQALTTHTRDLVQAILGDDEISHPQQPS